MSQPFKIDWSQLWYPGPTRRFSAQELKAAGADAPSATLSTGVMINVAWLSFMVLQLAPAAYTPRLSGLLMGLWVSALGLAYLLWRMPSRCLFTVLSLAYTVVWVAVCVGIRLRVDDLLESHWCSYVVLGMLVLVIQLLLFTAFYRAHQIELRLNEQDERKRAEAARHQLASAQIQPHFLFNSLASLQHWVQTKDERAGPLLISLTAYLRATLPLFNQPNLKVGDELQAVQHYLEVMQARLGSRLSWQLEVSDAACALSLPPALLLTLVENAIEHGVQAALHGASVRVLGRLEGGRAVIEVHDTGPGLANPEALGGEGTGLTNSRVRLRQAFGDRAQLSLSNAPEGGCIARLEFPITAMLETKP